MKTSFRPGLKFGENQVNGRVCGLRCKWLVPRTMAFSDDVDWFLTLRVDPLKEGSSTLRAWPNQYLRGHRIMLCDGTISSEWSGAQQATKCREGRRCPTHPQEKKPICRLRFTRGSFTVPLVGRKGNGERSLCGGATVYASPSTGIHATNSSARNWDASPFCVLKIVQN
ncbi:hypothetical protein M9H77_11505 [Catharanthus roseus]|uniref:Uncharacterized protein n=1 Tax=Catharanthus roseus TaxID=4058 RepID=A0ACC0BET9_CATRO|nr:hypothetical protein M9H77_11505 [Catharanthus roseus]